jgi:hypothetical protein
LANINSIIDEVTQSYFISICNSFENALSNAQRKNEIMDEITISSISNGLTSCVLGIFVLMRGRAAHEQIKGSIETTNLLLDMIKKL